MERVLIVGGSGYVGQYLCAYLPNELPDNFEYYATYNSKNCFERKDLFPKIKKAFQVDFLKEDCQINDVINEVKPTYIVNPSAWSAVAQCQNQPNEALRVNDPSWWAKAAKDTGVLKRFIHFSTDMVYHGNCVEPYKESDDAIPLTTMTYGVTKKKGEDNLLSIMDATILRSALVIGGPSLSGFGRGSCLDWVQSALKSATPEAPAKFFGNEYRTPVLVNDIVRVVAAVINKDNDIPKRLILNMGGATECSRFEIGEAVAKKLNIPADRYKAVDQEPICGGIERPLRLQMNMDLLKSTLGIQMRTLQESVDFIFSK